MSLDMKRNEKTIVRRIARRVARLAMLAVSMAAYAQHSPAVEWVAGLDRSLEAARRDGRPVVVLVTARVWCDPCSWLEVNTLSAPDVQRELADHWIAVRILDTDATWQRWEIDQLPAIVILDSDGNVLERLSGSISAQSLLTRLIGARERTSGAVGDPGEAAERTGDYGDDVRGAVFRIGAGTLWNDRSGAWYSQDAGLPPRLDEYDRDAAFLYLRDESSATILAISVDAGAERTLWRWDQQRRAWTEVGPLRRLD